MNNFSKGFPLNFINAFAFPIFVIESKRYSIIFSNDSVSESKIFPDQFTCDMCHDPEDNCKKSFSCVAHIVSKTSEPVYATYVFSENKIKKQPVEVLAFPVKDDEGLVTEIIICMPDFFRNNIGKSAQTRELVTKTLQLSQKNELLNDAKNQIKYYLLPEQGHTQILLKLVKAIEHNLKSDNVWDDFKKHFEAIHPDFFARLQAGFPKLTNNELRHCAYIRMKLNRKETARLMNITVNGVRNARNRMRKKLGVPDKVNLIHFIAKI